MAFIDLDDYFDDEDRKRKQAEAARNAHHDDKPALPEGGKDEDDESRKDNRSEDDFHEDYIVPKSKRRKRHVVIAAGIALIIILTIAVLRMAFFIPSVPEATTKGYVLNIGAKKGLLFTTFEGRMILDYPDLINDSSKIVFDFSTTDPQIARRLRASMKSDSVALIEYKQYRNALPWRGETNTIVTGRDMINRTPQSRTKK